MSNRIDFNIECPCCHAELKLIHDAKDSATLDSVDLGKEKIKPVSSYPNTAQKEATQMSEYMVHGLPADHSEMIQEINRLQAEVQRLTAISTTLTEALEKIYNKYTGLGSDAIMMRSIAHEVLANTDTSKLPQYVSRLLQRVDKLETAILNADFQLSIGDVMEARVILNRNMDDIKAALKDD